MSILITFGQSHTHRLPGITLDKDIVARVRDREHAFELFGDKFATSYEDGTVELTYFPRGIYDCTRNKKRT